MWENTDRLPVTDPSPGAWPATWACAPVRIKLATFWFIGQHPTHWAAPDHLINSLKTLDFVPSLEYLSHCIRDNYILWYTIVDFWLIQKSPGLTNVSDALYDAFNFLIQLIVLEIFKKYICYIFKNLVPSSSWPKPHYSGSGQRRCLYSTNRSSKSTRNLAWLWNPISGRGSYQCLSF